MTSTITATRHQADGRAYITEQHIDIMGIAHINEYLSGNDTATESLLMLHAEQLAANLKQGELDHWLSVVKSGRPIPVNECQYISRGEAMVYAFRSLAFDSDPHALLKAAWMVPYFADSELLQMGFDLAQISEIRTKSATLEQVRQLLESVTPLEV